MNDAKIIFIISYILGMSSFLIFIYNISKTQRKEDYITYCKTLYSFIPYIENIKYKYKNHIFTVSFDINNSKLVMNYLTNKGLISVHDFENYVIKYVSSSNNGDMCIINKNEI